MSIVVKYHWAERFINWFPFNTKLYIRGERGKNRNETDRLYKELFDQLVPFLDKLKKEAYDEGFSEGVNEGYRRYHENGPY